MNGIRRNNPHYHVYFTKVWHPTIGLHQNHKRTKTEMFTTMPDIVQISLSNVAVLVSWLFDYRASTGVLNSQMNSLIFGGHNTTLLSMMSQMLPNRIKSYIRDQWNKMDKGMYFVLLLAVILRFALPDQHFIGARYVYSINLVMFYLRILQLYYVNPRLGPKVLMIWRMVCTL